MLAIGTDCAGLTLVAANHLFLVDVALSAGSVAQLIGRIARQGQARPACFVYHLVVRRSIEERVLRLRASAKEGYGASEVVEAGGTAVVGASSTDGLSTADLFYLLDDGSAE